jgi:tetratricopeptide (TPR) repeat protein
VALVRHLVRTGRRAEAEAQTEEAKRQLPPDRAPLALANCREALGQVERAAALYREALAARPTDFVALRALADFHCRTDQFREAEPYLRKLLDPKTQVPEEYVAQARRQLAVGLAAGGGAKEFADATALLEQNAWMYGRTAEDDRARAFVLGTHGAHREEALRLLGEVAAKPQLTPEGQFLVARAYEAAGDSERAHELMLELLSAQGDNPQFLAYHIRSLLRRGERDDAHSYFSRLETMEPQSHRTQELRAALKTKS